MERQSSISKKFKDLIKIDIGKMAKVAGWNKQWLSVKW
jgi:hypothetical protein